MTPPGLATPPLDPRAAAPLWRQLYNELRAAILDGRLPPGTRLPSTRDLATELAVSRTTVLNAFEQLLAEGYIEGRVGSGSYVAQTLPEDLLTVGRGGASPQEPSHRRGSLSQRGALLASLPLRLFQARGRALRPFLPWTPALDAFPIRTWARLVERRWRDTQPELLARGDPAGFWPLREAIAAYLSPARGVRCDPEQVIVVAGMQQAFELAARMLLDPEDVVWMEDPGYPGARGSFVAAGARVVPIPVDDEGFDVDAAIARSRAARLVYVTPSHQYPLGMTMSLPRRLALLDWAGRAGAWVLEDDYDSEYRYAGRPLAALQGLDRDGRVLYLGTVDKVLFPALCLGYLVVPPDLVDAFTAARSVMSRHVSTVDQAVVADFMTEGHFARHLRCMRLLYAERQAALVDAASEQLSGLLEVQPSDAGMHLVGWLPEGMDDQTIAKEAAHLGVEVPPLSAHSARTLGRGGLLLGYTAFMPEQIRDAVRALALLLEDGTQ